VIGLGRPDIRPHEVTRFGRRQHDHLRAIACGGAIIAVACSQFADDHITQKAAVIAKAAQLKRCVVKAVLILWIKAPLIQSIDAFRQTDNRFIRHRNHLGHQPTSAS
jgi:hypothetical protein